MNIKSLLIGSAAALMAVTGARAADAVVVPEPEPVEYVRVCDMYGAGYFYIPGTETCLRIGGKVWYSINATSNRGGDTPGAYDFATTNRGWQSNIEADLDVNAKSETEWGTLESFIRIRSTWGVSDSSNQFLVVNTPAGVAVGAANLGTDGVTALDQAWLSIGGLRMGYTESAWSATVNGGVSSWGSFTWNGLNYRYQQRNLVQYNFGGGNGFFGTVSLEDDGNPNFIPDAVAVVGVSQGWGAVWAKVAYDEDLAPAAAAFVGPRAAGLSGVDGWAAQLGAAINVPNMPGSVFKIVGYYANNANQYSVGGRWSVLAAYRHQFTPAFAATIAGQYIDDTNFAAAGRPTLWQAELGLYWTPVQNLEFSMELNHAKATGLRGTTSGFIRATRSF
ncbi:MAG: porin [Rhizobiaceae bacterium]